MMWIGFVLCPAIGAHLNSIFNERGMVLMTRI